MPTYKPDLKKKKCVICKSPLTKHQKLYCDHICQRKDYEMKKKHLRLNHDNDKKVRVQVDTKTWIMIRQGEDPVKAKEKYLRVVKNAQIEYKKELSARSNGGRKSKPKE